MKPIRFVLKFPVIQKLKLVKDMLPGLGGSTWVSFTSVPGEGVSDHLLLRLFPICSRENYVSQGDWGKYL